MPGIIRRQQPVVPIAFSFAALETEGADLIERAKAEADRTLADARERARALEQEARSRAHAEGLAAGLAEGAAQAAREGRQQALAAARAEVEQLAQALRTALVSFDQARHRLLAAAEHGVLELAMAIARRVCKHQASASIEPVLTNMRAALELVRNDADVRLLVSPAQRELLQAAQPDWLQKASELQHVTIEADPMVPAGGCLVQTRNGRIDARLETQLDRIAADLLAGGCAPAVDLNPAAETPPTDPEYPAE